MIGDQESFGAYVRTSNGTPTRSLDPNRLSRNMFSIVSHRTRICTCMFVYVRFRRCTQQESACLGRAGK